MIRGRDSAPEFYLKHRSGRVSARYHHLMAKRSDNGSALSVAPAGTDATGDSKSAQTRARILDAAAHVLSVKGYAGLRLTDVAEQAELQAPAIYYYYPSRDDLIEEVMWVGIADTREHVAAVLDALPPESSAMDRMLAAVEAHLRHTLEIPITQRLPSATPVRCR